MKLVISLATAAVLTFAFLFIQLEITLRKQNREYGLPVSFLMEATRPYEGFKPFSMVSYDVDETKSIEGKIIGVLPSKKMKDFMKIFDNYEIRLLFRELEIGVNEDDRYLAFIVNEIVTFERIPAGEDLIILDATLD